MGARRSRLAFLLLAIAAGVILQLLGRDFQPLLATGDHGRDLYAAWRTLEGEAPYRDYWWNYGPLMPYYYAAFFGLFGVEIQSVQLGYAVLDLASGLSVYAIVALVAEPALALLSALWFWAANPDFFHTWNHVGAVLALLVCVGCLLARRENPETRWLWVLPVAVLVALLVKPNVGAAVAVASSLGLVWVDWTRPGRARRAAPLHAALLIAAPLLTVAAYAALTRGLPRYYLLQCLPWAPGYDPGEASVQSAPVALLAYAITRLTDPGSFLPWDARPLEVWPNRLLALVVAAAAARCVWRRRGAGAPARREVAVVLGLPLLFALAVLHEFWLSATHYRLFWAAPLFFVSAFQLVALALRGAAPRARGAVYALLLAGVLLALASEHRQRQAFFASPDQRLSLPGAEIVVGNPPEWIRVVEDAVHDLERRLDAGETFFALPYDPLYYYLTRRPSPVRESIFFDYVNVSEVQQRDIVARLARRGVDTVLLSNRAASSEAGLGLLGRSHGVVLAQHLARHFEPVASYGDWRGPGGWASRHAVRILRRRPRSPAGRTRAARGAD